MAFKITVTIKTQGKDDVVEYHTVSRQAFLQPALAKLRGQHQSGKQYEYNTEEIK